MAGQRAVRRGWSTEERRSSVREGERAVRRSRFREMVVGERRRRRSLGEGLLVLGRWVGGVG